MTQGTDGREVSDEGPAGWAAAWGSRGEVVLPQRRRALWWRFGCYFLLLVNSGFQMLDNLLDEQESTFIRVISMISVPAWVCLVGYTIWQLVTRRPMIRIDRVGLHYGHNKRYRFGWDQIATISDPIGKWAFPHVNVRLQNHKPRRLPISHLHVEDLGSFARWLRARLEEQRRTPTPTDH